MKFELNDYHRNTPETDLILDIQRVANLLNKDFITMKEYCENGNFHSTTIRYRFGSWTNGLIKAGLNTRIAERKKTSRGNVISDKQAFINIENVWIKLGRQPKYNEIKYPFSEYSAGFYDKRFGSWRIALEKFIGFINSEKEDEDKNDQLDKATDFVKKSIINKTKRQISERLRFRILLRDSFTCKKCGRSPIKEQGVELHVDHIIPWSKGGETISENLETKCRECNLGKGNAFNE